MIDPPPAHASEREIFLRAAELEDPEQRLVFLEQACRGDKGLRAAVDSLLESHHDDGFLETPAVRCRAGTPAGIFGEGIRGLPAQIGRYRPLREIGEGGCGVVYLAEQIEPIRRTVALKVIRPGMDTRGVIARFEAERQALALMDHPNIARVLDAGATDSGRPFFVMEFVHGTRITDFCETEGLGIEARLRLFLQVCQGIEHAHQKGVIHRDIKPSNLLVSAQGAEPVAKVIDFGVAKATRPSFLEQTVSTQTQILIGTPAYMSPEQAEPGFAELDARADVYSLGVVLYELLTSSTPFDLQTLAAVSPGELRRHLLEADAQPPSARLRAQATEARPDEARRHNLKKAAAQSSGELDWVVLRALEKDRARRYASAGDLAADLERYLRQEPVRARPPSLSYRLHKFANRNRQAVAWTAMVLLVILVAATMVDRQSRRARDAETQVEQVRGQEELLRKSFAQQAGRADEGRRLARLSEYVVDINLAHQSLANGNLAGAVLLLEKQRPQPLAADLRGFEWRYLRRLSQGDEHRAVGEGAGSVLALAWSQDRRLVAVGQSDRVVILEEQSGAVAAELSGGAFSVAFEVVGGQFIAADRDLIRVWRTNNWSLETTLWNCSAPIATAGRARLLAASSREGISLWDTEYRRELRRLPGTFGRMALSGDGERIVAGTAEGLAVFATRTGEKLAGLEGSERLWGGPGGRGQLLAFAPDGKTVVAALNSRSAPEPFSVGVWDAGSGRRVTTLPEEPGRVEHASAITGLAFAPDGQTLASSSWDHSVRLWDMATRQCRAAFRGSLAEVWAITFSPDGQSVVSGGKDGQVLAWPVHPKRKATSIPGDWIPLGFSGDGSKLAAYHTGGALSFFDPTTLEPTARMEMQASPRLNPFGGGPPVAVSTDLTRVAEARRDGTLALWHPDHRAAKAEELSVPRETESLALSPSGRVVLAGGYRHPLEWFEPERGKEPVLTLEGDRALFSGDGESIAEFTRDRRVRIWTTSAREVRQVLQIPASPGFCSALSWDGALLATTSDIRDPSNVIFIWDTRAGKLLATGIGHKQAISSVAFSPDGRTLASSSGDGTLKFWNIPTGTEMLSLAQIGSTQRNLLFSPDGRWLAMRSSSNEGSELRLLEAPPRL
jgi:eukaryotic-like serine/threonine-protein kinase